MTEKEQQRISKREFLSRIAGETRIQPKTVSRVYDAMISELIDITRSGDQLMLSGFGKFYPQPHKGHRVQFAEGGSEVIEDYFVLKFSATREVNKSLAQKPSDIQPDIADQLAESMPAESEIAEMDQGELFETKPVARKRASAKAGTTSQETTASMAAAATQSTRATSRAKRQAVGKIVRGFPADSAL